MGCGSSSMRGSSLEQLGDQARDATIDPFQAFLQSLTIVKVKGYAAASVAMKERLLLYKR
jgi:hypothetical protein